MKWTTLLLCLLFCGLSFGQEPVQEYLLEDLSFGSNAGDFLYDFSEIVGTNVGDLSGNGNNATHDGSVPGAALFLIPETGQGLSVTFDDLDDQVTGITEALTTAGPDMILGNMDDIQRSFTVVMWAQSTEDLSVVGQGFDCTAMNAGADGMSGTADDVFREQRCLGLWRKGNGAAAEIVYSGTQGEVGPDLLPLTADDVNTVFLDEYRIEMVLFDPFFQTSPSGATVPTITLAASTFSTTDAHLYIFSYDAATDTAKTYVDDLTPGSVTPTVPFTQTNTEWWIGQLSALNPAGFLGTYDIFAVTYDTAITDAEASEVYRRGIEGEPFIRGDGNNDGTITIADVIAIGNVFNGMFLPCMESGDTDGNGAVGIGDMVYLAASLFSGGPDPVAPFPACGPDGRGDNGVLCLESSTTCDP